MSTSSVPKRAGRARVDGRRVLFELEKDGVTVPCAISLGALQDLGGRRYLRPPDVMPCFVAAQPRIEAAARRKLQGRAPDAVGLLNLWADDFEEAEAE